ncbi:MAG: hypothetical protein ACRDDZ_02585 [Marinifilaceae bacterium]
MESEMNVPINEGQIPALPPTRPIFLSVLCVLTYVGSGFLFLFSLLTLFYSNNITLFMLQNGIDPRATLTGGNVFAASVIGLMLSVATIIAASKMWRLQKYGFWMYVVVQCVSILLVFDPMVIIGSALFILLYSANYKVMS